MIPIVLILAALLAGPAAAQDEALRVRAARLRAQAHLARADWAAAAGELEILAEVRPGDPFVLGDLAQAYRALGRTSRAETLYRDLVSAHPQSLQYRSDLAFVLYDQGRMAEVCEILEPVRAAPESAPDAILDVLAEALERSGRGDRAEGLYQALQARRPTDTDLLTRIGEWRLQRGQRQQAREYFEAALQNAPDHARALKGLAAAVEADDPARRLLLLGRALELDPDDPEPPYLLGEAAWETQRAAALAQYSEALDRLGRGSHDEPYYRAMAARLRYRLGQRAAADSLMAELVRLHPEDVAQRNDFADVLLEDRRPDAALVLLPPGTGDRRSSRLRAAAYVQQGVWPRAAEELRAAAAQAPGDVGLALDLAEALARAGAWPEALGLQEGVLFSAAPPAARERAHEQRRALLTRRGKAAGLSLGHTAMTGESAWSADSFVRWPLRPDLGAELQWRSGWYRDDQLVRHPDFSARVHECSLGLLWSPRLGLDLNAGAHGLGGHLEKRLAPWIRARLDLPRGATLSAEAAVDEPWREPVDAVADRGLVSRAQVSASLPLAGFYLQAECRWRSFELEEGSGFGDDGRLSLFAARPVLEWPGGAVHPLRAIGLTLSQEISESSQKARFAGRFQLPESTRALALGAYAHLLWAGRGHLDVAPFLGLDSGRDLGLGELYGLSLSGQLLVGTDYGLRATAFTASESSVQTGGGTYRSVAAELVCYLN